MKGFEDYLQCSTSHKEMFKVFVFRLDAYRRSFDLHSNFILAGAGATSKSYILECLEKCSIPDTTQAVSHQTSKANAIDGNQNDMIRLYHEMPLPELGRWADARCRTLHGNHLRTYIVDRNINYTNVCTAKCTFCAFRRDGHEEDAYTLTYEELKQKVSEIVDIGGTQILMQGGMNPELPLNWYIELLEQLRSEFPMVHIHAFSPPEVIEFINFY